MDLLCCPFCGHKEIATTVVGETFIDIYPDEAADVTAKAMQVTAICQCKSCYARVEDWARMLVPHVLYRDADGSGVVGYRRGEYMIFVGEVQEKAKEMAQIAWNRRAYAVSEG